MSVAPTVASSRNLLPPLNAAAVVQVMQAVQRVLGKRDVAVLGRRKEEKENVAPGARQKE